MIGVDSRGLPYGPDNAVVNPDHKYASALGFAWAGGTGHEMRDLVGNTLLQPLNSTGFLDSEGDGVGIDCTAADRGFEVAGFNAERFRLGFTGLWRGVIRGAQGSTNYGALLELGNSSQSFGALCRDPSNADVVSLISQSGGSYIIGGSVNLALSSLYNVPVVIAFTHTAGTNGGVVAIKAQNGFFRVEDYGYAAATNAPMNVNGSERIRIGNAEGAGRYANAICTGAALWDLSLLKADIADILGEADEIFAAAEDDGAEIENLSSGGAGGALFQSFRRGIAVGIARGV